MGKTIWGIIIAFIILMIGLAVFPGFKTLFGQVSTSGMSSLNIFAVKLAPYIAILLIGYCVYKGFQAGNK